MRNTFHARIYEADSCFYEGELESLVIPTIDGEYGVLANHYNVCIAVVDGLIKYTLEGGEVKYAAVSTGMMRMEDNDVLVLVDSAEHPEEIDANKAREKEIAAREAMLQKKSMREYALAEASLKRAVSRLRIKNNYGNPLN